jgi:hypothetical protein
MDALLWVLAGVGLLALGVLVCFLLDMPSAGQSLRSTPEHQQSMEWPQPAPVPAPPPPNPDVLAAQEFQRLIDEHQRRARTLYDIGDDLLERRNRSQ